MRAVSLAVSCYKWKHFLGKILTDKDLQVDEGTGLQQLLGNLLLSLACGNHQGGSTILVGNVETACASPDLN